MRYIYMKYFYGLLVLILFASSNSIACDISGFSFGKSLENVADKYEIKQKSPSADVTYLETRLQNICKSYRGIAELKFFKDKLFSISFTSNSDDLVLLDLLKDNKIVLNALPNKAAIKQKFASSFSDEKFNVQYEAQELDGEFYEKIIILERKIEKEFNEYIARDEENAGK